MHCRKRKVCQQEWDKGIPVEILNSMSSSRKDKGSGYPGPQKIDENGEKTEKKQRKVKIQKLEQEIQDPMMMVQGQ